MKTTDKVLAKPRLLDLFCGAGGAALGYKRAGFHVTGVDINPQPRYAGDDFIQADLTEWLEWAGAPFGYDAVHASPPCQVFTRAKHLRVAQGGETKALDLVAPTRDALRRWGLPYVIENVPGAPLINPAMVCGSSFSLMVRRHRLFETSLPLVVERRCRHREQGRPVGVYHVLNDHVPQGGTTAKTLYEGQAAMGIDWMTWSELKEAVPPAYTEWIGRQVMQQLLLHPIWAARTG